MKPADIKAALENGDPTSVLINRGGWQGARPDAPQRQFLKMMPAYDDADDTWIVQIFSHDGVAVHELWVDAENILAVCVPVRIVEPA